MYVCMYPRMYVCTCMYMYVCMHASGDASIWVSCMYKYMHAHANMCLYEKFVYVSASRKITNIILYSSACFRYTCTVPYSVSLETDTDILHSIYIGIFIVLFYQFLSSLPSTFDTRMFT